MARRLKWERERRGWSLQELADRMTEIGCGLNKTQVRDTEVGKPLRNVFVEELYAYSRLYEVSVDELLMPVELVEDKAAREAVVAFFDAERDSVDALLRKELARATLAQLLEARPDLRPLVEELLEEQDTPQRRQLGEAMERFARAQINASGGMETLLADFLEGDDGAR